MKESALKRRLVAIYEVLYEKKTILILHTRYRLRIMGTTRTIRYIKKTCCSISRFGDGELKIMVNAPCADIRFQRNDPKLAIKLKNIFQKEHENLLICMPHSMNGTVGMKNFAKEYWLAWSKANQIPVVEWIWKNSKKGKDSVFGDSLMTRPYMDRNNDYLANKVFSTFKELWDQRSVLIIEGEQTRMGVGNDLFDNVKSVKRILAPSENAFDHFEKIIKAIQENWHGELILLALGPTASVLAADLADLGMRALDVGHLDIEYEWFLQGAKKKTEVAGKYTNEVKVKHEIDACLDINYLQQIVCKVGC